MAATTFRAQFTETVTVVGPDDRLEPVPNIATTIFSINPDGTEGPQAPAYAGRIGNTPASSLNTDVNGNVSYWLNAGDYNIHFDDPQNPPRIQSAVKGFSSVTFSQAELLASNEPPPLGILVAYGGSEDPVDSDGKTRWMVADGRALNRAKYSELFAVFGTTFGAGNGDGATFSLPDPRSRFLLAKNQSGAGTGAGLGDKGGTLGHQHDVPSSSVHGGVVSFQIPTLTVNPVHIIDNWITIHGVADGHSHAVDSAKAMIAITTSPGNNLDLVFSTSPGFNALEGVQYNFKHLQMPFSGSFADTTDSGPSGYSEYITPNGFIHLAGQTSDVSFIPVTSHNVAFDVPATGTVAENIGPFNVTGASTTDESTGPSDPAFLVVNYLVRVAP